MPFLVVVEVAVVVVVVVVVHSFGIPHSIQVHRVS